jgi:hypothetical protein
MHPMSPHDMYMMAYPYNNKLAFTSRTIKINHKPRTKSIDALSIINTG